MSHACFVRFDRDDLHDNIPVLPATSQAAGCSFRSRRRLLPDNLRGLLQSSLSSQTQRGLALIPTRPAASCSTKYSRRPSRAAGQRPSAAPSRWPPSPVHGSHVFHTVNGPAECTFSLHNTFLYIYGPRCPQFSRLPCQAGHIRPILDHRFQSIAVLWSPDSCPSGGFRPRCKC